MDLKKELLERIIRNFILNLCYRDRCRNTANVLGDSFGTRIVEQLSRGYLMSTSLATSSNGGLVDSANSSQSGASQVDTTRNNDFELHKTKPE